MRLIDADALLKQLAEVAQKASEDAKYSGNRSSELTWDMAVKYIQNAPTIEPERKKGKWIKAYPTTHEVWMCSECHYIDEPKWSYCHNCGAEMEN